MLYITQKRKNELQTPPTKTYLFLQLNERGTFEFRKEKKKKKHSLETEKTFLHPFFTFLHFILNKF